MQKSKQPSGPRRQVMIDKFKPKTGPSSLIMLDSPGDNVYDATEKLFKPQSFLASIFPCSLLFWSKELDFPEYAEPTSSKEPSTPKANKK